MKKVLKAFLFTSVLFSIVFASSNAKVQFRPLPNETLKMLQNQLKEEEKVTEKHQCRKKIQTGIFYNQFPPVYFPYSCHFLSAISALGDSFALEDGSIWTINPNHRDEVMIWNESDALLIYPNRAWISSYNYIIFNQTLETETEVNMTQGPLLDGEYSLRIIAIDFIRGEVFLNDNSRWTICSSDRYLLNDWREGDYILIGSNNSWFCSHKNILINSEMYNHVRAEQF